MSMDVPFPLRCSGLKCEPDELLVLYRSLRGEAATLLPWLALRHDLPSDADAVIVLGSDFELVPYHAAKLLQHLKASFVVAAGGRGRFTPLEWNSEGEHYARILRQQGVEGLLVESASTNTGENLAFTKKLLEREGCLRPSSLVVIQYPLLQRRAWLTARRLWPESKIYSWAPFMPSVESPPPEWPLHEWQRRILWDAFGETARIIKYQRPEFNYISADQIPACCLDAARGVAAALSEDPSAPAEERMKAAEAAAFFA